MSFTYKFPVRHFGKISQQYNSFVPYHNSLGCGCSRVCGCACQPPPAPENPSDTASMLVGKNINFARKYIYNNIRVVRRDHEDLIVTADYVAHRVNVETINDVIVAIVGFY